MLSTVRCIAFTAALLLPWASNGGESTWSRKGVDFRAYCGDPPFKECKPLTVPSPDGKSAVKVIYSVSADNPDIDSAELRVVSRGKVLGEVRVVAISENEIVWSPDSKAFFINGNNNGYGWNTFAVHRLNDPELGPGNISADAEEDVARSFPPCQAKAPPDDCAGLADDPEDWVGIVAIDWVGDSSRLVVMAEVTGSSSMGGIMCQVLGYEIEVPSGRILRRMQPKEFARRWQHSMAWKFEDPGPPDFVDKVK
jgi:hypothetical protein